ncbi:MAG: hypothetical protein ACYCX7_04820 [Solirubrobacteraceae bacterium]
MPPADRFVPCFAAEPPQEDLPYGRWAERLQSEFLAACLRLDADDLGEPGEIVWYLDRTWNGRAYVPGTALTSGGYEIFGYVSFLPAAEEGEPSEPSELEAHVDFTDETAERNPDWQLDICNEEIGAWRGAGGRSAKMTLIWGRALVHGGRIATAELADLAVDQCELVHGRFTLIAPDDYGGDLLELKLFDGKGRQLAQESLYEDDEEDGEGDEEGDEGDDEDGAEDGEGDEDDGDGDSAHATEGEEDARSRTELREEG